MIIVYVLITHISGDEPEVCVYRKEDDAIFFARRFCIHLLHENNIKHDPNDNLERLWELCCLEHCLGYYTIEEQTVL